MKRFEVPVDLRNPGQVFASLGFMEAALQLGLQVRGGFDWSGPAVFVLWGVRDPFQEVLDHLAVCQVRAFDLPGLPFPAKKWKVGGDPLVQAGVSTIPMPDSPATLAARLVHQDRSVVLDHWGEGCRRDRVKFWAGAAGMPGASFCDRMLSALLADTEPETWRPRPFDVAVPLSSSFRFDRRGSGVPMDEGFADNSLSFVIRAGYPLVELLAAVGLSHARPLRPDPRDKLSYRYSVLSGDHHPALLRAALGCVTLPYAQRSFAITLDWPGKEGQARCITSVQETRQ